MLVVEDEKEIRRFLRSALEADGYRVAEAETCARGVIDAGTRKPDLAILDLGLPDNDGVDFIRKVRAFSTLPILVLSARAGEQDKIDALDAGADDYLTKPFSLDEFEARVRALLRRPEVPATPIVEIGAMHVDLAARRLKIHGNPVDLTTREWALLCMFLQHPGRVLSKDEIIEELCSQNEQVATNTVEVYVSRLRAKIEPAGVHLRTVRGFGYLWNNRPDGG